MQRIYLTMVARPQQLYMTLHNVNMHFGSMTYTGGGTAAAARQALIDDHNWTITDGGTA